MQSIHLFHNIERALRMRPDAQRWRVTIRAEVVEVFRRPVLTSAVTLGALGLTNAPMPVPICVVTVTVLPDATAVVTGVVSSQQITVPVHTALAQTLAVVNAWVDPV